MTKFGLYVHIPFCKKICPYCVFPKIVTNLDKNYKIYHEKLITEIRLAKKNIKSFDTIYIGGGTPNFIPINYLENILKELQDLNPNEYTIELNPSYIDDFLINILKKYKINRVSLGVQTFNKKGLNILGRDHNKKDIKNAYKLIYENITQNISIDLIFNYPFEELKDLKKDLKNIIKLSPKHISAYDLIYEEGSRFTYLTNKGLLPKYDSDKSYLFYKYVINTLKEAGYTHYEISSFAKEGFQGRHNLLYWNIDNYLGVGLGAVSYINGTEITNTSNFSKYIKEPFSKIQEKNELLYRDVIGRYFYMGLRKLSGVSLSYIEKLFNIDVFNYYPKIIDLINDGLLEYNNDVIKLTEKGLFLGNIVFREFI